MTSLPSVTSLPTLSGVWLVKPRMHRDERGFFTERWTAAAFAELGIPPFVQENQSRSKRGTLRGLHFQAPPRAQGKLVSAVRGRVFDVAVDLRGGSDTFGRWDGVILDADDPSWLWVPPGFAHGFLVLSNDADVLYKVTDVFAPETEGGIAWHDPDLAIAWPIAPGTVPMTSVKDASLPRLRDLTTPF